MNVSGIKPPLHLWSIISSLVILYYRTSLFLLVTTAKLVRIALLNNNWVSDDLSAPQPPPPLYTSSLGYSKYHDGFTLLMFLRVGAHLHRVWFSITFVY